MGKYLAFWDERLAGALPTRSNLVTVKLNKDTAITAAFNLAKGGLLANEKYSAMFILCHGYAGTNNNAGVCMDAGGMGLQFGKENVLHGNVALWERIQNIAETVVVYACAAGNTESGNEGTTADGKYLMGALAIHLNAPLYAADRIQWYHGKGTTGSGYFDFGAWEGQLWKFPPTGNAPSAATKPPVEIMAVIAGTAP